MKTVKIKVKLVCDDWRDRTDLSKSVYHTKVGTELSMSSFHHGSTFSGEIEVSEKESRFLNNVMKDGWCPVFVLVDPKTKRWRWQ